MFEYTVMSECTTWPEVWFQRGFRQWLQLMHCTNLSETPPKPNFQPSSAVHSLVTVYLNISTYYLFFESMFNL